MPDQRPSREALPRRRAAVQPLPDRAPDRVGHSRTVNLPQRRRHRDRPHRRRWCRWTSTRPAPRAAATSKKPPTRTNLEAADEIARQMRLRDLGGLIVVDFIDMEESKNRRDVESACATRCATTARACSSPPSASSACWNEPPAPAPGARRRHHITCPRCNGTGHIRDTEFDRAADPRMVQEEAMKDNTAAVHVQVPVEVTSFLLNESAGRSPRSSSSSASPCCWCPTSTSKPRTTSWNACATTTPSGKPAGQLHDDRGADRRGSASRAVVTSRRRTSRSR